MQSVEKYCCSEASIELVHNVLSVKISEIRPVGAMGYVAGGNVKQAKGNECNQYKSTVAVRHQLSSYTTF
jgi:hypothetical protein